MGDKRIPENSKARRPGVCKKTETCQTLTQQHNNNKRTNSQNLSSDFSICIVAHVHTCIHTHMHTYKQTHTLMIINMHTHVHIHAHIAKLLSTCSFIRIWISNSKCCSRFPFYQKQAMYFCPNYVTIFFLIIYIKFA